ncbi:response regulator [Flavobacterium sp. 5]|uniref:response regulator n=1 Tax=Flavobacterium sp. 5 TaxID=2035199 RepID=UPI000C2BA812|nr:response regulator [Flavobacterium sp. 5]PKB17757.1 response regulator receiver domain-containing protein [Flavobacterium sp. 5]
MTAIKQLTLVDDDEVFVFLTTKMIEKSKLIDLIKIFENGLDALVFLKENLNNVDALPDIILLDLSMPIMDGWQFLEEYVKINPVIGKKIVIYICSSSISPDDISRATAINEVSDFIIKPMTKDKLVEMIKNL